MKREMGVFFVFCLLSISFVSAGLFSDIWGRFTGEVVSDSCVDNVGEVCDNGEYVTVSGCANENYGCASYVGVWYRSPGGCVSESECEAVEGCSMVEYTEPRCTYVGFAYYDVFHNVRDSGCFDSSAEGYGIPNTWTKVVSGDGCNYREFVSEPGVIDCNGNCVSEDDCISRNSYSCYNGDVYWYDSCGVRGEMRGSPCEYGCSDGECEESIECYSDNDCGSDKPYCNPSDMTCYECGTGIDFFDCDSFQECIYGGSYGGHCEEYDDSCDENYGDYCTYSYGSKLVGQIGYTEDEAIENAKNYFNDLFVSRGCSYVEEFDMEEADFYPEDWLGYVGIDSLECPGRVDCDGNCVLCSNSEWSPSVDTVCEGEVFNQTSDCGLREVVGMKVDGECGNDSLCIYDYGSKKAGQIGDTEEEAIENAKDYFNKVYVSRGCPFIEEFDFEDVDCYYGRDCIGIVGLDSLNCPGRMLDGECILCPNSEWGPSVDEYCKDEKFVQYSDCGERVAVGMKVDGECESEDGGVNVCSPVCDEDIIGFSTSEILYDGRRVIKMGSGDKALLMFHGTGGTSCSFAKRNKDFIGDLLDEGFSVYVFQGECPYCDRMQFSLDDDYDVSMVRHIIESEGLSDVYLYGFSQGAVFSMSLLDEFDIKGAVIDSGVHPDQVEHSCSPEFIDGVDVELQSDARVLLVCGELDNGFCVAQEDIGAENVRRVVVSSSGHEPHSDVEEIFGWILSSDDGEGNIGENQKNMDFYSESQVFLVSDSDWHDVLPFVSASVWTRQEGDLSSCVEGYGTADGVCVYPMLIFHKNNFENKSLELYESAFIDSTSLHVSWNFKDNVLAEGTVDSDDFTILFELSNDMYNKMQEGIPRGDLEILTSKIDPLGDNYDEYDIFLNGEYLSDKNLFNNKFDGIFWASEKGLLKEGINNLTLKRTGGNVMIESYKLVIPYFALDSINDDCDFNKGEYDIYDLCIKDVKLDKNEALPNEEISYSIVVENIGTETVDLTGEDTVFQGVWHSPEELGRLSNIPYDFAFSHVSTSIEEAKLEPGQTTLFNIKLVYSKSDDLLEDTFDIDSSIYFMQQYDAEKVKIIGETPQNLDNLLVVEPDLGVGLDVEDIERLDVEDYFSYWNSYRDIVYVEDDYELALLASVYASLINAPLVISGMTTDEDIYFNNKNIICVGNPSQRSCDESYDLEELQEKYVDDTDTDKVILVNPDDLDIRLIEIYETDKSDDIYEIYGGNSLASSILASAKHELIISIATTDYEEISEFVKDKINLLMPEIINNDEGLERSDGNYIYGFLTIFGAPNAIPMREDMGDIGSYSNYRSLDASEYGDVYLDDGYPDMSVGRIQGITISDVSAYLGRDLFYDKIGTNEDISFLVGDGYFDHNGALTTQGEYAEARSQAFANVGYSVDCRVNSTFSSGSICEFFADKDEWFPVMENKDMIYIAHHGSSSYAGIQYSKIPLLESSIILSLSCSTCSTYNEKSFCNNLIRRGAIANIAAVSIMWSGETAYIGTANGVYKDGLTVGESFANSYTYNKYRYMNTLLGDPTFDPNPKYLLQEELL